MIAPSSQMMMMKGQEQGMGGREETSQRLEESVLVVASLVGAMISFRTLTIGPALG